MKLPRMMIRNANLPIDQSLQERAGVVDAQFLHQIRKARPVFLSHKSDDVEAVEHLSKLLHKCGVSSYMDTLDENLPPDNADLVHHIRRVLQGCSGLLAYATLAARQSWWVPLEIGFAMESASELHIATLLADPVLELPSYLWNWPILTGVPEVILWAVHIRDSNPGQVMSIWETSDRRKAQDISIATPWLRRI